MSENGESIDKNTAGHDPQGQDSAQKAPDTSGEPDRPAGSGEAAPERNTDLPDETADNSFFSKLKRKWAGFGPGKSIIAACCVAAAAVVIAAVAVVPANAPKDNSAEASARAPASALKEENASSKALSKTHAARTPQPSRTASPTPRPTPTPRPYVEASFDHSIFIGSSTTEAMYIHNVIPDADYLYGTGLTVETVFEKTMPGSDIPIVQELGTGKTYDQVFLVFGLNELGWADVNIFLQYYAQLIQRVREYQPDAVIYVESVLPVGIETSRRNRFGVNQDRINEYNELLARFAEENGAYFLDVTTGMKGPDGYLPQDASSDGIHPNLESCRKWADLIAARVEEVLNAENAPELVPIDDAVPAEDTASPAPDAS